MLRRRAALLSLTGLLLTFLHQPVSSQKLQYPATRTTDVVDDYHGTKVPDPYRWMENSKSPELGGWIAEQNELTESYLRALPIRAHFQRRIARLWNFRKTNLPIVESGRIFYRMNTRHAAAVAALHA